MDRRGGGWGLGRGVGGDSGGRRCKRINAVIEEVCQYLKGYSFCEPGDCSYPVISGKFRALMAKM